MTTSGAELLRMLGSVVTPATAPGAQTAAGAPGAVDFQSLLQQASRGTLASGRQVTIARNAQVQLSDEQLSRVSAAADQAEAQGATRALVLIDGKAVTLDVASRQITGSADLSAGNVLTGVDAVVNVPAPGAPGRQPGQAAAGVVPLPRAGPGNPSLVRILSQGQPGAPPP